MKLAIIVLMAMVGAAMADCDSRKTRDAFEAFKRKFRKVYKDLTEENYRCKVFGEALDELELHNARYELGLETWYQGINQFSDLTTEEFVSEHTGFRPELQDKNHPNLGKKQVVDSSRALPTFVDWVQEGYVTPVRDQGKCGSCYSFASVGVIESRYLIKKGLKGEHLDHSEQHYVDCSGKYGNQMCMGGLMTNTFNYMIQEERGSLEETIYPYESSNGENRTTCDYKDSNIDIRITGFVEVKADENSLLQAVAEGPVAVGVDAKIWSKYAGGIFCKTSFLTGCSSLFLNHAVIVVGYDTKAGYLLIKNSWGTSWGENGYMRLCTGENACGVNRMASYPIIA